jgi:hypothetical protein
MAWCSVKKSAGTPLPLSKQHADLVLRLNTLMLITVVAIPLHEAKSGKSKPCLIRKPND